MYVVMHSTSAYESGILVFDYPSDVSIKIVLPAWFNPRFTSGSAPYEMDKKAKVFASHVDSFRVGPSGLGEIVWLMSTTSRSWLFHGGPACL